MDKISELLIEIEKLRNQLNDTVKTRDNLTDQEVLSISKKMDEILVQYWILLKQSSREVS